MEHLKEILLFEDDKDGRIEQWKKYAKDGKLFNISEEIPEYDSDTWHDQYNQFSKLTSHSDFAKMNIYKFFQAASYHKHYVLRELLPSKGIIVV